MAKHKVTLNYVVIEDNNGHDILRFKTVEEYEDFFEIIKKNALPVYESQVQEFATYYNVDIDGVGYDLTNNQFYDGQDIELDNGNIINI